MTYVLILLVGVTWKGDGHPIPFKSLTACVAAREWIKETTRNVAAECFREGRTGEEVP